jgi:TP901 family phage tail tape measure protein
VDVNGRLHDAQGKFLVGMKAMEAEFSLANGLIAKMVVLLKGLGRGLTTVGTKMQSVGKAIGSMGRSLSLRLTAPISLFAGISVRAFSTFNKAMTESLAIMTVTGDQTKRMTDLALELGGKVVQSPRELAEAYFFLASAGLDAEQSMAALPQIAAFASAGAFDMATATDLVTDAQTAMGLSSEDAGENLAQLTRISDVFVAANELANTSVQQVAEAMTSDAAVAARGMGQELETVVAVLDAYGSSGKKAGEAGNLFGRATRLLTKAQRENGEVFEKFGIKVIDEVTGNYRNFIDIIADMETAFADLSKPQRDAALETLGFAALAQKSITPLLGLSDAMKGYEKSLIAAGGATTRVAAKQAKAFGSQMKILWNQVTVLSISIGEILAPWLTKLGDILKVGIKLWAGLSDSTKKIIVIIGLVIAAIGPLLVFFGAFIVFVGFIISGIGALITATIAVVGFMWAWVPAIIGVVAAFVVIGASIWHIIETLGIATTVFQWFQDQWVKVSEIVGDSIQGIKDAWAAGDIELAIQIAWVQIQLVFLSATKDIQEKWHNFVLDFKTIWIKGTEVVKNVWNDASARIQRTIIRLSAKAGSITTEVMNEALKTVEIELNKQRKNAADASTAALKSAMQLADRNLKQLHGRGFLLQQKLNKMNADAAKKAQAEADKADAIGVPVVPDLKNFNIPTPDPVKVKILVGANAVAIGSAEAEAAMADFMNVTGQTGEGELGKSDFGFPDLAPGVDDPNDPSNRMATSVEEMAADMALLVEIEQTIMGQNSEHAILGGGI